MSSFAQNVSKARWLEEMRSGKTKARPGIHSPSLGLGNLGGESNFLPSKHNKFQNAFSNPITAPQHFDEVTDYTEPQEQTAFVDGEEPVNEVTDDADMLEAAAS